MGSKEEINKREIVVSLPMRDGNFVLLAMFPLSSSGC